MRYLIGRDLDGDGRYEFVQDLNDMILTEDPGRALQFTKSQLNHIDMGYLNAAGFYALEADRFHISLLGGMLFALPLVMGFRPRVAPPPRRRMAPPPPPRPLPPRRGSMSQMVPRTVAPPPRPRAAVNASAPRVYGPRPGGSTGSRSMGPGAGRAKGAGSLRKMGHSGSRGPR